MLKNPMTNIRNLGNNSGVIYIFAYIYVYLIVDGNFASLRLINVKPKIGEKCISD